MSFPTASILVFSILFIFPKIGHTQLKEAPRRQIYFQHDNDVFRLVEQTDRYYSFGLLTGYSQLLSKDQALRKAVFLIPDSPEEKRIFTMDFAMKGYTPEFDNDTTSGPKRPFAGVSVFQFGVQSSTANRMLSLGLTLGVRGPASGAETVQDNFHRLIQDEVFEGWSSQLSNKFLYGIRSTYARSFKLTSFADLSSITELALGNYQSHLDERITLRIGRLRPLFQSLIFGNHLGELVDKPEFYLSGSLIGRAVLVDTTFGKIDCDLTNPNNPNKSNLLAGYEVSAHFQSNSLGLYLAHNRISSESDFSTKHSYGSIGISYSF